MRITEEQFENHLLGRPSNLPKGGFLPDLRKAKGKNKYSYGLLFHLLVGFQTVNRFKVKVGAWLAI